MMYGIEGVYTESFEKPIKLHLTEGGASNALFFFSECRKFIAKSCTAQEMTNIRKHAGDLRNHFSSNRNSLLTRIFGAYKLQVYSSDLYFIVTNNVLLTDDTEMITEKFDLKGSSVHRHMKLPRDGETTRCRVCGSAFVYNSKNHARRDRDMLMMNEEDSFSATADEHSNGSSPKSDHVSDRSGDDLDEEGAPEAVSPLKRTLSRRMSRRALSGIQVAAPAATAAAAAVKPDSNFGSM
jgi:hypothetical protein